jgi:hypothetical protein
MIAIPELYTILQLDGIKPIYGISSHGNVVNIITEKLRIQHKKNGYLTTSLCTTSGKHKTCATHRLVAHAFINNIYGKPYVNHKDGNKSNNHVSNLEWVTQQENVNHSVKNKLINPRTRYVKQFSIDNTFIKEFSSTTSASKSINLSRSSVEKACDGSNPTAGGFIWKYSIPNAQCNLDTAKSITGYPRYKITKLGEVYSNKYKRLMKLQTNKNGYKWIQFSVNSRKKNFYIHQLVAIHYIQNPNKKPFVNHKDGNKTNNMVENLEWVTQSENTQHYYNELRTV